MFRLRGSVRARRALGFAAAFLAHAVALGAANSDARALEAGEIAAFIPLICAGAVRETTPDGVTQFHCNDVIGYSDTALGARLPDEKTLTLVSVLMGGLTALNADQAYVSYRASFAAHADNFGGGILFERKEGTWRLVQWYPGAQRDECLALPGVGPAEALCRFHDGHIDSSADSIEVAFVVPQGGAAQPAHVLSNPVIARRDNNFTDCSDERDNPQHRSPYVADPCAGATARNGLLVEIRSLHRAAGGRSAEAAVLFAPAEEVERACLATCFRDASSVEGRLEFGLQGRVIDAGAPERVTP